MSAENAADRRSSANDCYPSGVWFQSAVSGLWYQNRGAAGDVSNVNIDGVIFRGPERPTLCEHGIPDGDWCEECNREYKEAAADPDNGNGEEVLTYDPCDPADYFFQHGHD